MVRRPNTCAFLSGAILLLCGCAFGEDGIDPKMSPSSFGKITTIIIERQGATSRANTDPEVDCSGFVLSEREVDDFFANAGQVSKQGYHHMLDWSVPARFDLTRRRIERVLVLP